tara:strand:- start:70 stop:261 length:192 start_codon:yes stop_codon:yes gene_type:complete
MPEVSDYYMLSVLQSALKVKSDLSLTEALVQAAQAVGYDKDNISSCSNKNIIEGLHKIIMEEV